MNCLKKMWYKNDVFRVKLWFPILVITAFSLALTIAFTMMGMHNVLTIIVKIVACLGGFTVLTGLAATLID